MEGNKILHLMTPKHKICILKNINIKNNIKILKILIIIIINNIIKILKILLKILKNNLQNMRL